MMSSFAFSSEVVTAEVLPDIQAKTSRANSNCFRGSFFARWPMRSITLSACRWNVLLQLYPVPTSYNWRLATTCRTGRGPAKPAASCCLACFSCIEASFSRASSRAKSNFRCC
eukprot:Lithocolla_globosa_v1_NODE_366_length_4288_cov_54.588944.p5 type:complete len:113 gc:universal NODE_366_length_4288_cov_54.588944:3399-3737(+)